MTPQKGFSFLAKSVLAKMRLRLWFYKSGFRAHVFTAATFCLNVRLFMLQCNKGRHLQGRVRTHTVARSTPGFLSQVMCVILSYGQQFRYQVKGFTNDFYQR